MGNPANAYFLLALLAGTAVFVWLDPPRRAAMAARWRARRAERTARRIAGERRDTDLDALHRQYRSACRYYDAGHNPAELGPLRAPSLRVEPDDTRPVLLHRAALDRARRN